MARRQPKSPRTSRQPRHRKKSDGNRGHDSSGDTAHDSSPPPPQTTDTPPWRWAHFIFGLLHFFAAWILWKLSDPREGAVGAFAYWTTLALVAAGVAWSIFGLVRARSKSPNWARFDELHPRWFFLHTWQTMDAEAAEERRARRATGKSPYDYRPILALCGGAVFLTLMEYFGGSRSFSLILNTFSEGSSGFVGEGNDNFFRDLQTSPFLRLLQFAWWSGWRVLGYFILPVVLIKAFAFHGPDGKKQRGRIRDHGLNTKGFSDHAWIYGFGYYVVFICVVLVSYTDEFSHYYPFYKLSSRSWFDFLAWEVLYAAQFFSLEFFFRGWWLKTLKPAMGSHAIFVMVVPYCMIHYGKPFPETMGAILAGLFLGTLAMKTRSIWSGFLIHVSVAISMDTAALLQTAGLPDRWWPAGL